MSDSHSVIVTLTLCTHCDNISFMCHLTSFAGAALPVLVQLTYTSAFGAYAGFVHLRTGHIAAAIASHSLCNYMGLPDLSFAVPPSNSAQAGQLSPVYSYRKVRHYLLSTAVHVRHCTRLAVRQVAASNEYRTQEIDHNVHLCLSVVLVVELASISQQTAHRLSPSTTYCCIYFYVSYLNVCLQVIWLSYAVGIVCFSTMLFKATDHSAHTSYLWHLGKAAAKQ
jgi:hypothetical protein